MISGASEEELDMANARADIILALDNTAAYESWLYIDTYIDQLEQENKNLQRKIKRILDTIDNQLLDGKLITYDKFRQKLINIAGGKDE